jgi:uncharacterized membrane protein
VQLPKSVPAGEAVDGGAVVEEGTLGAFVGAIDIVLVTVTVIAVWEKQVINFKRVKTV